MPGGRRKQVLLAAADDIFSAFADQILPVDAALATRNVADFDGAGIEIIDPWAACPL